MLRNLEDYSLFDVFQQFFQHYYNCSEYKVIPHVRVVLLIKK